MLLSCTRTLYIYSWVAVAEGVKGVFNELKKDPNGVLNQVAGFLSEVFENDGESRLTYLLAYSRV